MLQFQALTKDYGDHCAVDAVSFDVRPGEVTAFVGATGAGKTTTIRMLLGLARPTSGRALVHGRPYAALADPSRTVGAVLDGGGGAHPRRTGRRHLRWLAPPAASRGRASTRCSSSSISPMRRGVRPGGSRSA